MMPLSYTYTIIWIDWALAVDTPTTIYVVNDQCLWLTAMNLYESHIW